MGSLKKFEWQPINDPCLLNLNLEEFILPKLPMNIYNPAEFAGTRNPKSSSSSSSSKPSKNSINAWNEIICQKQLDRNGEEFLQNTAPFMANIDQEFRDWHQGMMVQANVGSDFEHGMKMMIPAERCSDSAWRNGEFVDEKTAKSVEKRQRRMIKNRESAARSRARKQEYINQLQQKVLQLQATNQWLRKRKEVITHLNSCTISRSRPRHRRTSSAEF